VFARNLHQAIELPICHVAEPHHNVYATLCALYLDPIADVSTQSLEQSVTSTTQLFDTAAQVLHELAALNEGGECSLFDCWTAKVVQPLRGT
jgi:hypothetical protein